MGKILQVPSWDDSRISLGWTTQDELDKQEQKENNKSQFNGDVWEYAEVIVFAGRMNLDILKTGPHDRMEEHFNMLKPHEQEALLEEAEEVFDRLQRQDAFFRVDNTENNGTIELNDQPKDVTGDVRDIIIRSNGQSRGISAKNNSKSLRSLRIGLSNPNFTIGLSSILSMDESEISDILSIFGRVSGKVGIAWCESPEIDKKQMYIDVYSVLYNRLISYNLLADVDKKITCENIYKYMWGLTGGNDYYYVARTTTKKPTDIVFKTHTELPSDMSIFLNSKNEIVFGFNRGPHIKLRVHNSSSKIETSFRVECELT